MKYLLLCCFVFFLGCDNIPSQEEGAQGSEPVPIDLNKPTNIIFMVGDGMGISQVTAGLIRQGNLNLEKFKHIGLIKTSSGDNLITDSAAGATAFSVGKKIFITKPWALIWTRLHMRPF